MTEATLSAMFTDAVLEQVGPADAPQDGQFPRCRACGKLYAMRAAHFEACEVLSPPQEVA